MFEYVQHVFFLLVLVIRRSPPIECLSSWTEHTEPDRGVAPGIQDMGGEAESCWTAEVLRIN